MCRLAADFVATAYGGAHGILWSTQMHVDQDHTGEPHQGCGEEDLPAPHEPQSTEVLCHQSCERKNVAEIGETDANRIEPRDS